MPVFFIGEPGLRAEMKLLLRRTLVLHCMKERERNLELTKCSFARDAKSLIAALAMNVMRRNDASSMLCSL